MDECSECNGLGGHGSTTCSKCNGKGEVTTEQRTIFGSFMSRTTCSSCGGTGKTFKSTCSSCRGTGKVKKNKDIEVKVPAGVDIITGIPRELCLAQMARYRKIYGVDRVALEALVLGCEVLPYEPTYPDPSIWKVLDNKEAAVILQEELDKIDG